MLIHKFAVSLFQVPEGYQFVSRLEYPKRIRFFAMILPILAWFGFFGLAISGIIGDSTFRNIMQYLRGPGMVICILCIWTVAPIVRGVIQREMSYQLGYKVSFDAILLSRMYGNTYTALSGQWQRRRDVILISIAPLSLYILIFLVLIFLPSSSVRTLFALVLIMLASETLYDLLTLWDLLKRPQGTILYTESFLIIQIFELLPGITGKKLLPGNVFIEDQHMHPAFQWQISTVDRREVTKEDKDIVVYGLLEFTPGKIARYFTARLLWLLPDSIYEISSNIPVAYKTVVNTIFLIADDDGTLIDIKFAAGPGMPFTSLFPINPVDEVSGGDEVRRQVAQSSLCEVQSLIKSGFYNMNPVLVTVLIQKISEEQTSIRIKGFSIEGLIPQHAAEKAARSFARWIEGELKEYIS